MTGEEFKAALARLRLRQAAFARRLGLHEVTVSRWATGSRRIPNYIVAYLELAESRQRGERR
jgi:DNA-binding transcriptional regulator YiaG